MGFQVVIDRYVVHCQVGALPYFYEYYKQHAVLADEVDLPERISKRRHDLCFFGVGTVSNGNGDRGEWPKLTVAQRFDPDETCGFAPGALIVPETDIVFLGAGERLLAYRLDRPERLWQDSAEVGFSAWRRHGDVVVMSAELELAAWTIHGEKLWTTFVAPPWSYRVKGGSVRLDVMGEVSRFPLASGPLSRA